MEALLQEMGDDEVDNNGVVFVEDADSSASDDGDNHEMEDSRMRRLLRASSSESLQPGLDCSSSYDEEEVEPASESSEEETGHEEEYEEEIVDVEDVDNEDVHLESATPAAQDEEEGSVVDEDDIEDTLARKPKEKKEKVELPKLTDSIDENDPEAAEMKKLLGDWGVDEDKKGGNEDSDSDEDDESDDEDERIVVLDPNVLDHIVLAAPDLDEAVAEFEQMTGTKPIIAGTINGLGIRCARVSFNDSSYLEIIAPDHKKIGPIGTLIKAKEIKHLTPFAFAIRSNRAEDLKQEVQKFGYTPDHITMFGGSREGEPMKWEVRSFSVQCTSLHGFTTTRPLILVAHCSSSFCMATKLVACVRTLLTGTTPNTLAPSSLS